MPTPEPTPDRRVRLVDAPALPAYDLGVDHPFARDRQLPLFDLIHTLDLVGEEELFRPRSATPEELEAAHHRAYIEAVMALSEERPDPEWLARAPAFGMATADNPIAPGQHRAAAAVAGAGIACAEAVQSGASLRTFHPAGGLHHAMPDRASGFCIYNDLVLAIRRARALGAGRVLYVDFDVHHGDGVEYAFRSDPEVLTISFHETPEVRWPFTGRITDLGEGEGHGYALNVPLHPGTADDSWLECVDRVLLPAARAFAPDLIVSQHGCDPHREDPLATLETTTRIALEAAQRTRALADELCGGRWLATGGGGYQPYRVIPRAWTMVWSVVADRELPDALPEEWCTRWENRAGQPLPRTFLDREESSPRHARAAEANRRTVDELLALVAWLR